MICLDVIALLNLIGFLITINMKFLKLLNYILFLFTLSSCSICRNKSGISEFSSELINLYSSIYHNKETILSASEDSTYWYLRLASGQYLNLFNDDDYVGYVKNNQSKVYIFGLNDCIFYSVNKKRIVEKKLSIHTYTNDTEPLFWQIAIKKDTTFCKYRTYIVNPFEDISCIQNIANKYYKNSILSKDEVFSGMDVEQPAKASLDAKSIKSMIEKNYRIKAYSGDKHTPILVELLIYADGRTVVNGLIRGTGDQALDQEALRVAEIICHTGFTPAKHRGEFVNSTLALPFLKTEISHR